MDDKIQQLYDQLDDEAVLMLEIIYDLPDIHRTPKVELTEYIRKVIKLITLLKIKKEKI